MIRAVKGEIRQVLSNLFTNAIDASPNGGLIQIRVRRNGNHTVRMEIEDHGPGISPSDMKRLFQPFFTTKPDVGNGLGLWVSKNLIEKNGGAISVETSVQAGNTGSTFSIQLPAAAYKKAAVQN
jgi:signal transduction histidine kinase